MVNDGIGHTPTTLDRLSNSLTQRRSALIKLLVLVILIVVLASIALAPDRTPVIAAREGVLKEDLFRMREAIDRYYADRGHYPRSLDALVSDGYLRALPDDPFTKTARSWRALRARPDAKNPTAEPGIYDVKSGSNDSALDGTKYAEW
jgi:general secretion pathway protein G